MMLTNYQQTYGEDPLLVDDLPDDKWHEDELMMAETGLGQKDYQQVVRFARSNNSRTGSMRPGTVGIYYASENEMANFQFFNLSQAGPETFVGMECILSGCLNSVRKTQQEGDTCCNLFPAKWLKGIYASKCHRNGKSRGSTC
ncbi:hypothetical protein [[Flexibacter] sp. ATCC 35208]|uniref:hypothetical protein n=1 Tax=[Flexibacter] sp. ATCC 35208 TaxID=1936242 RepID=UPI0009D4DBED|nr:hypothetical protein [[Flexibacter] sp. ATCC 35208]OMP74682.1 hypothetical protein BW716_34040 [[Flexibacter] sp. ATCC 35208]